MKKSFYIYLTLLMLFFLSMRTSAQEKIQLTEKYNDFVTNGLLNSNFLTVDINEKYKDISEKEFTIEAIYEGSECERKFVSFEIRNAYFPITWYELDNFSDRKNPIINANPSHLNDHTTYIIEDFYFHTDTVHVDFEKSIMFENLYPNPANEDVTLDFSVTDHIDLQIRIFDSSGRQHYYHEGKVNSENEKVVLQLGDLGRGVYFISLKSECINQTVKFIKVANP